MLRSYQTIINRLSDRKDGHVALCHNRIVITTESHHKSQTKLTVVNVTDVTYGAFALKGQLV